MTWPIGAGIGATQALCIVMSDTRAAGILPIKVVKEPIMITPGPPGTHGIIVQSNVMSPTLAAGIPPIITVGQQGGMIGSIIGG